MKDYVIIKKTDIVEATTIKYSHNENNMLVIDNYYYYSENKKRKVICIDHHYIDIKSGDELYIQNHDHGLVEPPIYRNTIYILSIKKLTNVSDQDLLNANKAYLLFMQKQKMVNDKKLVLFPQERIY